MRLVELLSVFVPLALMALGWLAIPLILFYFGRRIARALERRSLVESHLAAIADRLYKLEERVEDVAMDTARVSEGQRFTTALYSGIASGMRK
ncbi:MAG TPA: hypothetical protein VM099_04795 [Gemmatimonadaceae bacterium]|nr:hypothetical protein [Gemmatimonadaceae bacterium]